MSGFVQALRAYREGALSRESLLTEVERQLAERQVDAVALLKLAADRQDKIGKGEVELPAREMIGDMLRLAGRPTEALSEYRKSLQTDPGRFNTLLHAGEMAEQLGLRREATGYYRLLLRNAARPSPRYRQSLERAREFLACRRCIRTPGKESLRIAYSKSANACPHRHGHVHPAPRSP